MPIFILLGMQNLVGFDSDFLARGYPLLVHKNLAGGPLVKLIISRAATARLVSLTRFVATSTPTRRGGSAD